jgi:ADP-ribose pyrophosphatase
VKLPGRIENVEIVKKEKVGNPEESSYLTLYSLLVENTYTDGTKSAPYRYEAVLRKWLDAVVLVLWTQIDEKVCVCLRTSIRPPLLLRPMIDLPQPDDERYFAMLELPAGLIEASDQGEEGLRRRAAAETFEETGYQLSPNDFTPLGCRPFVTPGVIPEKMIFLTAKIADVGLRSLPEGDGSPSEEGADIMWVGVDEAVEMCNKGEIVDMKTELGIRRLGALLMSETI